MQKGDSLYKIANKFNVTVEDIKRENKLNSNLLNIGQVLIIPRNMTYPQTEPTDETYIVQKGDSLYSIAKKFNTTVDELKSLNNLSSNLLSIGQKLKISLSSQNIYVVQKGDSLYSIANKFNTTVNELKSLNNLSSNLLSIGQQLIIPS